jgi:hypothetical protein
MTRSAERLSFLNKLVIKARVINGPAKIAC